MLPAIGTTYIIATTINARWRLIATATGSDVWIAGIGRESKRSRGSGLMEAASRGYGRRQQVIRLWKEKTSKGFFVFLCSLSLSLSFFYVEEPPLSNAPKGII